MGGFFYVAFSKIAVQTVIFVAYIIKWTIKIGLKIGSTLQSITLCTAIGMKGRQMNLLKEWSYDVNQVEQFVAEKCYLDSNISNSTANMYQVFLEFTKEVGIKLPLNRNSFRKRILSNEEVSYEVQGVYGVYDIVLKLSSKDAEKLRTIITNKVRKIGKIQSTLTMMVIEEQENL